MEKQEITLSRVKIFLKFANDTLNGFMKFVLFLLALGGAGAGIASAISQNIVLILISIILIVAFVVIAIIIFGIVAARQNAYQVRVLKKFVTYRYYPDGSTMDHTKRYEIVSLVDGVQDFVDRYKWACRKQERCRVTLLTASPQQQLREETVQEWFINRIIFNPPLDRGKTTSIVLSWDLFCEDGAVHFLSQPVEHPTDYLELAVFLPATPSQIKFTHFNNLDGLLANPSTIVNQTDALNQFNVATGEVRYAITHPEIGHKYMISWTPSSAKPTPLPTQLPIKPETEKQN